MKQPKVVLNCARLFAATGLVLFFLTSCTNYWLHAVTCPNMTSTEQVEENPNATENSTGMNQESFLTKAPVHLRKKRVSQPNKMPGSHTIISVGNSNSTGMNQESFPMNAPVAQPLKGVSKPNLKKNAWGTLFFYKDKVLTYHHEGFFWRCWFTDRWKEDTISKFIFINQPPSKCCKHAYRSPYPSTKEKTTSEFDSALVYRDWWSALMFLAVIFITVGFIFITLKAFCENCRSYKAVGIIFLLSGVLFALSIIMYACWISKVHQMIPQENTYCEVKGDGLSYGWSFMAAPVGIFFCLIAGLLFIKVSAYQENAGVI